jgi:WD40 repeat protein
MQDPHCLLSGSKDSEIFSYDLRVNRRTAKYRYHNQEVCALKVQSNGGCESEFFASGSNDRNLVVWNTKMKVPMQIYKHGAAVKGVSWHPTKSGVLVSGGGIEDRCIKIWNINTN